MIGFLLLLGVALGLIGIVMHSSPDGGDDKNAMSHKNMHNSYLDLTLASSAEQAGHWDEYIKRLKDAANLGCPTAQAMIASNYEKGIKGFDKNEGLSEYWRERREKNPRHLLREKGNNDNRP